MTSPYFDRPMLSAEIIKQRDALMQLQGVLKADEALPRNIDRRIAEAFELPFDFDPYSTSIDAAWTLKDKLCPERMTLFRDYPENRNYIVDLRGDDGESSGRAPSRARAFIVALLDYKVFLIECGDA